MYGIRQMETNSYNSFTILFYFSCIKMNDEDYSKDNFLWTMRTIWETISLVLFFFFEPHYDDKLLEIRGQTKHNLSTINSLLP